MESLLAWINFRSTTAQTITHGITGPNCQRLLGATLKAAPPGPKGQRPPGPSSLGAAAWKESFVQYLLKSLARPWQEGMEASTPSPAAVEGKDACASPAGAEGKDACSEAGGVRSTRAAAGGVLGTQRENYSQWDSAP